MQFFDDSLLPETQDPLVIQVAPYAPSFLPRDSDDIPVSFAQQVQKAVDCYNAGATVLHVMCASPMARDRRTSTALTKCLIACVARCRG